MGRKLGSKNKKIRAKARSAYDTYSYWYDKYTKGEKAGWFRDKLSEQEFNEMYDLAKKAGIKVILINESYTSGCSCLDGEKVGKSFYNKKRRKN